MAKISEKHKPLYTSKKRYKYEKGGRGSGKSFAVTDYALRMTYDKNRVILFMRYTMIAASISIVPEFESAMEREGVRSEFDITGYEIVNKFTGSKIIFKGVKTSSLNQTANLKSIQGLTDVIYDEFEEHPDQESFDKLDESIREITATNNIVLVSNALHKQSWQYKQFWVPSGLYYDMTEHILTTFEDNKENLSDSWHEKRLKVKEKDPKKYNRDYLGIDYEEIEGALWKSSHIVYGEVPFNVKIIKVGVAIDPAVTSNPDSDETGIISGGVGTDGKLYVYNDLTGIYTPNGWARKAIMEYDAIGGNVIIGEVNNGGDMVETVIRNIDNSVAYRAVRASRGKAVRAEPVVSLYEDGKVIHCKAMTQLEQQMTSWVPGDAESPGRIDALVWLATELMTGKKKSVKVYELG